MSEQSPNEPPAGELQDGEAARPPRSPRRPLRARLRRMLRIALLLSAVALILFWGYALHVIGEHIGPGAGIAEWMPAFPMTLILVLLTLPALIIGLFGRNLIFGVAVAAASAVVNAWVWQEILAGLAG
jgi:hypothetical protein